MIATKLTVLLACMVYASSYGTTEECMCLLSTSTYSSRFFSDLLSTF